MGLQDLSQQEASCLSLGQSTPTNISDAVAHTGLKLKVLQFIEDTVIASITETGASGTLKITGVTFVAGMTIYGQFTAITLTSGSVRGY